MSLESIHEDIYNIILQNNDLSAIKNHIEKYKIKISLEFIRDNVIVDVSRPIEIIKYFLSLVDIFHNFEDFGDFNKLYKLFCRGRLDIIKCIFDTDRYSNECILHNMNLTDMNFARGCSISGNLELVEWYFNINDQKDHLEFIRAIDGAVSFGKLHILKWLINRMKDKFPSKIYEFHDCSFNSNVSDTKIMKILRFIINYSVLHKKTDNLRSLVRRMSRIKYRTILYIHKKTPYRYHSVGLQQKILHKNQHKLGKTLLELWFSPSGLGGTKAKQELSLILLR